MSSIPTATGIPISSAELAGRPYRAVVAELRSQGLRPKAVAGGTAPSQSAIDTVISVHPDGTLGRGDVVEVRYYGRRTPPVTPSPSTAPPSSPKPRAASPKPLSAPRAPKQTDPRTVPVWAGSTVTVSWPAYRSCPPQTSLVGYDAQVSGAASDNGHHARAPGETSLQLQAGRADSGPITVRYRIACGQQASGYSPRLTLPVGGPLPPKPPTLSDPSTDPVPADSTMTVSWPEYTSCPGAEVVSDYSVHVSGAGSHNGDSILASTDRSLRIGTGAAGSGPIAVEYKALCGQGPSRYSPTLSVRVVKPAPPPSPPTLTDPSVEPVPANSLITVSWAAYGSCPAGEDLHNYSVQVAGTASNNGDFVLGAGTASLHIQAGDAGSGPIAVRYKADCGDQTSDYSDSLTITVAAPEPAPTGTG